MQVSVNVSLTHTPAVVAVNAQNLPREPELHDIIPPPAHHVHVTSVQLSVRFIRLEKVPDCCIMF